MLVLESAINGHKLRYYLKSGEIFMRYGNTEKWKVKKVSRDGDYLRMHIGNKRYSLHRVIYKIWNPAWDIEDGSIKNNSIDHINGHKDDNRIANLRNVTHQQNHCNRTTAKGYYFNKKLNKYQAQIYTNGKTVHLGLFVLEADAHNAYLEAKKIYHII